MKRLAVLAGPVLAAVLAAGCSSGNPGDISATAARVLQTQVQHVRDVAATGDYTALKGAVDSLKAQVNQFQQDGEISSSRAVAIEDAADKLLEDASPSPSPTPSVTTTSPSPTPTPTTTSPTPSPSTTTPSVVITSSSSSAPGNGIGGGGGGGGGG
jgi:hypothetical protein